MPIGRVAALALAVPLLLSACATPPAPPAVRREDLVLPKDSQVFEARVPPNATLAGVLRAHELGEVVVAAIVDAAHAVFDVRRLRADQPYRLEVSVTGAVREFVYRIDADRFLRVSGRPGGDDTAPGFEAAVVPYRKETGLVALRGAIDREHSSLVAAMQVEGEDVTLAIALAEILGGEIDFSNDLQPGDTFELLFEKKLSEGQFAGYGPIAAAEFHNDGRVLKAFRFQPDGEPAGYYDEHGRSLKRFLLRSPLKFEPRVSSGFSMRRLHPVLGTWRAHPAIDYVAPVGAPVVAVAGGTVTRAGWMAGGGNTVTIRHPNAYESSYLHLSAFAPGIRSGARVDQGQLIGKVGRTGLTTGPHLDFRLKKNGAWVNPLVEQRKLPPGDPVPATALDAFHAARDEALARFVSAPAPQVTLAAATTVARHAP